MGPNQAPRSNLTTYVTNAATGCPQHCTAEVTNNDNDDLSLSKLAQIFQIPLNWFACRLEKRSCSKYLLVVLQYT